MNFKTSSVKIALPQELVKNSPLNESYQIDSKQQEESSTDSDLKSLFTQSTLIEPPPAITFPPSSAWPITAMLIRKKGEDAPVATTEEAENKTEPATPRYPLLMASSMPVAYPPVNPYPSAFSLFRKPKETDKVDDTYSPYPWPKRITIRHVEGNNHCMPLATNYTSLDILFAPDYRAGKFLPMLDVSAHRFDNSTYAGNVGFVGRFIPRNGSSFCEILGFNAYYDYRQGNIGYYNQVSAGLEILGRRWDFRANAYVPFGAKRHCQTCVYDDYIGDYYAIMQNIESISYSFSGEIGYLLLRSKYLLLYIAAGPYYIASKDLEGTRGGEVRIRPQYKDYVALDLSVRHDSIFKTIWQAEVIFSLPLYQLSKGTKGSCGISPRQVYQPVDRFEVMSLTNKVCWEANFD